MYIYIRIYTLNIAKWGLHPGSGVDGTHTFFCDATQISKIGCIPPLEQHLESTWSCPENGGATRSSDAK